MIEEEGAILAHEIGQLQHRNPAFSTIRKLVSNVAQTGATVAPAFGQIGMLAVLGFVMIHAIANVGGEENTEDQIKEADRLALHYLADNGYDPQGLMDVLQKFLNADSFIVPLFADYYQMRPISNGRMESLEEEFLKLPLEGRELLTRPKIYQDVTKPIREIYRTWRDIQVC